MDSIMHVCKKPDLTGYKVKVFIGALLIFFFSEVCIAQMSGIRIEHFYTNIDHSMLTVDADISYHLSKETRDALEHGVPLEFDIEFRIKKERDWIWDEIIAEKMITFRVEHQPLSGHYLVIHTNSSRRYQFNNLQETLEFIGVIKNLPLIGIDMISPEKNYFAETRVALNIQALPAPLRPLAYISTQWQLSSAWHTWAFNK
jgi:hypothetical protein